MSGSSKQNHWADMEEAGFYWGLKSLAAIYRIAGRRVCLAAMYPVLLAFFLYKSSARLAIHEFLERVSEHQGSMKPTYWTGFKNFVAFGGAALDKLSAWNGDIGRSQLSFPGDMKSLFEIDPEKKGAILLVSHLGNVEVIRALASLNQPRPITVLVHTKHAKRFNSLMARFNPDSQLRLVEVDEISPDVAMHLRSCIDRGEWIVIAADRPPVSGRENVINVSFLGKMAPFALGPYVLAHILEAPVFMVAALRKGDVFEIVWSKLSEKISLPRKNRMATAEKWAKLYAQWLEALAIENPHQWFNFFAFWTSPQDKK